MSSSPTRMKASSRGTSRPWVMAILTTIFSSAVRPSIRMAYSMAPSTSPSRATMPYIACDRGIEVVNVEDPLNPRMVGEVGAAYIHKPRAVEGASLPFADARNIYVARTYTYIAGGAQGLVIVDVTRPEHPRLDQV